MKQKNLSTSGELGRTVASASMKVSTAALVAAGVLLILFQFLSQGNALRADMVVQTRLIADSSGAAVAFRDSLAAQGTLNALSASPNINIAGIFDSKGDALATWAKPGIANGAWPPKLEYHQDFGLEHLDVVQPIYLDGREIGHVAVRVRLEQFYQRLLAFVGFTLIVGAVSLGCTYVLLARMRRKVIRAETDLHHLAHTDSVTALPNRHAFNAQLTDTLRSIDETGGRAALLLLDLDNFKIINDTLGHQRGDLLLQLVARKLSARLPADAIVCRIGGDEFAIIMTLRSSRNTADEVGERALSVFREPFVLDGHEMYVTASIGISLYPRHATDGQTLTRNADTAMYQAKAKGKNAFEQFHPDMDVASQRRLAVESGLRKALERGEMTVCYQPQIALGTGRLTAVEALLRWRHPELGAIGPDEFIPIAEECGMIGAIGMWAMRTACSQAACWRAQGLGRLNVAVNLSAVQIRDPGLTSQMMSILHATGLEAGQLELEITESVLMENVHANVDLLASFRGIGIRLAIDDFGTGYSSFAYLKAFPIDQIKIDRTFINDIQQGGKNGAIVTAIIAMAHELSLSIVAEGVETAEQCEFLRQAGCDSVQGYYFAKPMSAEQMTEMLAVRAAGSPSREAMTIEEGVAHLPANASPPSFIGLATPVKP